MLDWLAVVLAHASLQEIQERHPLAFGTGVDHGIVGSHYRSRHRTSSSERRAQIGAGQFCDDLFKCPKDEHLVLDDRPTHRSAKLIATKVLEWFAIRGSRGQRFRSEILETASVD